MSEGMEVTSAPIDLAKLRQRFDDDEELLGEIFRVFVEEAPQRRSGIEESLAVGDMGQLTRLAHALKGVSATIFAEELRQAAYALELASREGGASGIDDLVRRVLGLLETTSAYLGGLI